MHEKDAAAATYAKLIDLIAAAGGDQAGGLSGGVAVLRGALDAAIAMHAPASENGLEPPVCKRCGTAWPCLEIIHIGTALDVDVDLWSVRFDGPPRPPENVRRIRDDFVLAYSVTAEASYAHVLGDEDTREIVVCARRDDEDEPGALWEFTIHEAQVSAAPPKLLLTLYGEAFAAFADVPELFEALRIERPNTLAELRAILDRIGAWDTTRRQPPATSRT